RHPREHGAADDAEPRRRRRDPRTDTHDVHAFGSPGGAEAAGRRPGRTLCLSPPMSENVNDAVSDQVEGSYNESVHDLLHHGRAISIRRVNYHFGTGETRSQVLFENKLDVGRGEVVIMTGPSGSGKTTLLTLIGGLRTAQSGSIIVNDRELVGASRAALVAHR